jgi:hypothetical protein
MYGMMEKHPEIMQQNRFAKQGQEGKNLGLRLLIRRRPT